MSTNLLLGVHCHQPIDNFDYVIDDAIQKSYKPFFETLEKFPTFKISVHFSGYLLEYIEKNDSELFSLMKKLSPQIEFFTGGFYEPVLASIPSKDRIAQIKKLNKYIKKHFNQTPIGLWLTERVWENAIIKDLKKCGVEYVIVDDYHISTSGADTSNLNGYFITEDSGESIGVFPISQTLRYAIPFYPLSETNEILHSFCNDEGKNAAIIFDDGEKFGIWPKTYETVYEKKWLEKFCKQTIEDKSINIQTFKEFFKNNKPLSLTYLPTVSYFEMGEWSSNANDGKKIQNLIKHNPGNEKFIRGATWKNFLVKYQESNWIQKRFMELSKKQFDNKEYLEALYKAQCNDVLWHGVFGGIYLPNLRDNAYKYIIECEKQLFTSNEKIDIDLDGFDEYKYCTDTLLSIISAKNGGQIFELDILEDNFNLQNTLTRYEETYHKDIQFKQPQEEELEEAIEIENEDEEEIATIHDNTLIVDKDISLDYDWYLKKSVIDHIVPTQITIEEFSKNHFKEYGDFANQAYEQKKQSKKKLHLLRDGGIYNEVKHDTQLNKKYSFKDNKIVVEIQLDTDDKSNEYLYLQEWNLHFANLKDLSFNGVYLDSEEQHSNIEIISDHLVIKDKYLNKTINFTSKNIQKIFISSINSISQSEKGVDITNQGVSIGFLYKLKAELNLELTFNIENKIDHNI